MTEISRSPAPRSLLESYLLAKLAILEAGFEQEVAWQEQQTLADIDERMFLREAAWVVLSSGMRETVIRNLFPQVEAAFGRWQSASWIVSNARECRMKALASFHHVGKINAIVQIAKMVHQMGLRHFMEALEEFGPDALCVLPFIGPATSRHLAKNLGANVAKPDRHLVKVAEVTGFQSPASLCEWISNAVGDSVAVVDLVIWRYATIYPRYQEMFAGVRHEKLGFGPMQDVRPTTVWC